MKASIRDVAALRSIKPLEFAAYLRSTGWVERDVRENWTVWVKNDDFEISLPKTREPSDFPQRMADALNTLEVAEERSQLEILNDLLISGADIVRLRVADSETADGSIPIDESVQITQKAGELVMAAACAVVKKRPYFHTRKPSDAVEYMKKVRMGQTERGSYVLTVISPVAPALSSPINGRLFEVHQPFERRVIEMLARALTAVKHAAERSVASGSFDQFEQAVALGVSANLCDAIVGMDSGSENERGFDARITWSRSRPATEDIPGRILIPSDSMPVIQEAARLFREMAPREEFELYGPVVRLDRSEGAPVGKVTALTMVDGSMRRVSMELDEDAYHMAVLAHDTQRAIACVGILDREGRSYVLKNPHSLAIERDDC